MDRAIRWAEVASNDLESIYSYIALDSHAYASSMILRIIELVDSLPEFPFQGPVVPELDRDELRQITVKGYRVIYRVAEHTIDVLGVIHGARDLQELWEKEVRD